MHRLVKTTAIQTELLLNYKNYDLMLEEAFCLCQLKAFDELLVPFVEFSQQTGATKNLISGLVTKKMIKLTELKGQVYINLQPFYDKLLEEKKVVESGITKEQIEKISHLFGRNLKPNEIQLMNRWIDNGNKYEKIEEAIYTAFGRGITNLKYIETIINNKEEQDVSTKTSTVTRNWTF